VKRAAAPLLLAVAVLAALLWLEAASPYYFLQDDNRHQYLPLFAHAFDALRGGTLAVYDFHQFLGTPNLAMGQTAVLYPPMYFAFAVSALLTGQVFAGIDVLVAMHLVVAALGMYLLVRNLRLSREAAFAAGLSWALCSFVVYVGDSWVVYTGFTAWFPFLLLGAVRLLARPGAGPVALLVAAQVALFYVGHPQNFLYGVLFEVLFLGLLAVAGFGRGPDGRTPWRRIAGGYLLSVGLTAVACAPLLLPMLSAMAVSATRSDVLPLDIYLSGATTIKEIVQGLTDPFADGVSLNSARFYSFFGRPMLGLAFLGAGTGLLVLLRPLSRTRLHPEPGDRTREEKDLLRVWTASVPLAAFAFLWATDTWVTPLLYQVPILNRFRWPFKLTVFVVFFLILLGAAGMQLLSVRPDRPLRRAGGRPDWRAVGAVALVAIVLLTQYYDLAHLYLAYPRKSLKYEGDPLPLSEPFAAVIGQDRVASVGFDVGTAYSSRTLGYDYAALWGLYQFAGYEPFLSQDNENATFGLNYDAMIARGQGADARVDDLAPYRAWGVRYYVLPTGAPSAAFVALTAVAGDENRTLYRDDVAVPMAFVEKGSDASAEGVALTIGTNRLTVSTDLATGGQVVVCFLANPSFRLTVDGKAHALSRDSYGRMTFQVPAGRHVATLGYVDGSFALGLGILVAGGATTGAALWLVARRRRRRAAAPAPTAEALSAP